MSERTKWTDEQWEAITGNEKSLLVSAAAGAGKTAVLVERIIRKITDEENPVDIDRLLVVTFTNAAATEMRERIAQAISEKLEENPGSANIQRQLTLLGKACITTIHSFCLEVIRSNFQQINIDPGFRIADETESRLMKLEALDEVFEEQYENENEDFFELLECYGGNRDDRALQDMVLNLYDFIQSSPWPEEWLEKMTESMNIPDGTDFGKTLWGSVLLSSVKIELEGLKEMISRALEILKDASGLEKYRAVYMEDLANVDALLKLLNEESEMQWDRIFNALQGFEFATLPRCGREVDKDKQEIVKKIRDDVKQRIRKFREKVITSVSNEIISDLKALYPKMKCLANLVKQLAEKYAEKKNRKSVVDFNDLEHFCLEILTERKEDGSIIPSRTAISYRERFAEILVDEYQDSNLVQETIINMISKGDDASPGVFMVGDVKQSIYRFRQARPELFLEKYNTYLPDKGSPCRKIILSRNFRSRREVIDAVNFLFKQIMSTGAGELDYTDAEALNFGAVFDENAKEDITVGGEVEFHLIQTEDEDKNFTFENEGEEGRQADEGEEDEEMLDSIQCEARLVGRRILELMKPDENGRYFSVFDKAKNEYRRVEYRDVVILLRTTRNWAEVFVDELSVMGIPVFADTGTGFFKTVEVQVMLSLLQIIDNPLQDIPLLSVLRSPIVGFTTDELAELRLVDKKALLFDALKKLAESGQGEAAGKASAFLENLQKWREMSLYMSTDRLLWQLYNDTGYYSIVGAMPAGEQRQANLRILYERARQFEETSYKGLFNFINFIDKLKSSRGDMGSAKILSENDNVVRIMSIHKSKGLEFPVVIVAGCGKKFNLQDMNKSILLHHELGFGPDVVDHKLRLSWPSVAKQAIREKIKAETLSEEMRILYVALTRAREKLVITGAVKNARKAVEKWLDSASVQESRLSAYDMLSGANYLDWIGPALLRHKNCGGLRDCVGSAGFRGLLIDDPSVWSVKIWNKTDVQSSGVSEEQGESEFIKWLDSLEKEEPSEYAEETARRLSWSYPYVKASKVPAKVSVTELKRRYNEMVSEDVMQFPDYMPVLVKKPMFLEEKKGLTYAEKGTILHFVMQHLDYGREDIEAQIEEMVAKDLLTPQQAQSVDAARIRRFLNSPLGKRMLASKSINREVPFNIEIPCHELYRDMEDEACHGETLLLQGVVDCYFEEPDGIVLVDYKTDYVAPGNVETIRERYKVQILYYARALEMLTGKKVKEKYIYLFWDGRILGF
ncbi:helicase-exonuclease AddAB subunit AddA [Acetivibrio thermocellus]|uniref:helicase-exonuclease AddAB subunit AddA n=1 Tax=Acetivibrio thermocellus TaxID=1515 RepID=UPI001DEDF3E0|nr:helicase-exonuclease AddAB subunit AddA [Acetivibrio thermocellus]NLU27596.1 helicase-exonuclease AddAB subunit AddA [Acetivibrio thermocellus]UWV46617.1 helicase-exonuclease AddAB subunit AddA [Acetivibrio thermocellus]